MNKERERAVRERVKIHVETVGTKNARWITTEIFFKSEKVVIYHIIARREIETR